MNLERMKTLLAQVQQEKQAIGGYSLYNKETASDEPLQQLNNQLVKETLKKVMLAGAGAGAAIRGFHGITNLLQEPQAAVPQREIDLPVAFPKQRKKTVKQADGIADLLVKTPGALPAVLLGGPLSVYGGWKGMDTIMDKFRKKTQQEKLEDAQSQYEQALLGSYKKAVDTNLNQVFATVKQADDDWMTRTTKTLARQVPMSARNLYSAYALAAMPLSYAIINSHMKRTSPRAVLQDALQERARQRALTQPAPIYAYRADDEENQS